MNFKQNKKIVFFAFIFLFAAKTFAQLGGNEVYRFLSLAYSSKSMALGGKLPAYSKPDISYLNENPAYWIRDTKSTSLNFNYLGGGISFGSVNYFVNTNWAVGVQFIDYGKFTRADERAFRYEDFRVQETAFSVNYRKQLNSKLTVGVNIKPVFSFFYWQNSIGLASDWGVYYVDTTQLIYYGLVIRNLGFQIINYGEENENLPLEVNLGVHKILEHAPFAFNFVFHNIQNPNINYSIENSTTLFLNQQVNQSKLEYWGDNFLRHIIVGVEIFPRKNFNLDIGYNHQRRREMTTVSAAKLTGFSLGFSIRLKKFSFQYAYNSFFMLKGSQGINFAFNPSINRKIL